MKIRKLQSSDREALAVLQREFLEYNRKNLLSGEIKKFEEISNWEEVINTEFDEFMRTICFVAEEEGVLVGFIQGEVRKKAGKKLKIQGWIQEFFVTKNKRSQGIGMGLYSTLTSEFDKEKCDALVIGSFVSNTKSLSLYKRLGYIEKNIMLIKNLR